MFWSRLDDAKQSIESDRIAVTSPSAKSQVTSSISDHKSSNPDILFKVSEYLFDLFDANCTDGYKRIDEFEQRALKAFAAYDVDEFTFEQEHLHQEFLQLFENLIENLLKTENITIEDFYETLSHHVKSRNMDAEEELSHEITDVINFYLSFDDWARHMKIQSRYKQQHFQGLGDKLLEIKQHHADDWKAMNRSASKHESNVYNDAFADDKGSL